MTGKGTTDDNGYKTMLRILAGRSLVPAKRFGIAKQVAPKESIQEAVCFSEIPPGEWGRLHLRRKTKYGIGFRKDFLLRDGGGPIWYAWKDTPHWSGLPQMMKEARKDPHAPIWKVTPMIDAPGKYGASSYMFDWEREWRHVGKYSFVPSEVAFLLIPEELHDAARGFFLYTRENNLGPAYFCPYVDPSWDRDRILKALSKPAKKC